MATQMPIPPDFNRFIDPIEDEDKDEERESIVELLSDQQDEDFEEQADGSAIINLADKTKTPDEDPDFYENMAESYNSLELNKIASKYLDIIEKDKEAREERDKQYEEGLRRTGLGNDAPGGASFNGASRVVHPVMAEACVDFSARAIKELFPADGPVKTKIIGEVTEEKTEKA